MKKKEWVGLKFDMLTILEELPGSKFLVKCDCGAEREILRSVVYKTSLKSCGCKSIPRVPDLSGESFGILTIIKDKIQVRSKEGGKPDRHCIARCRCGNEIQTRTKSLTTGHTQSCGCVNRYALNTRSTIFQERNDETMYWSGFMASDGNVHNSAVSIGLKESDVDHLYKFKEWLGAETKIYYKAKTKSYCFRVKNRRVCEDLL